MKKILVVVMALCMVFAMSACSGTSSKSEAAMNTVQKYALSDEELELMDLISSGSEIVQYSIDDSFTSVTAGYDYFENGKLAAKNLDQATSNIEYMDGPQTTYGKVFVSVDSNSDKETAAISFSAYNKDNTERDTCTSNNPLSNYDIKFSDMDTFTQSTLDEPVAIEKGKKIYILAEIACKDKDETEVLSLPDLMDDQKVLSSYDKCIAFYLKFK